MRVMPSRGKLWGRVAGLVLVAGLVTADPAGAQSFREAVERALDNQCFGLQGTVGGYRPKLAEFCAGGGGGRGTASGATLTSPRDSGTYDERRVFERLEERREARGESELRAAAADTKSLSLGPFGLFASGQYQYVDQDGNRYESGYRSNEGGLTVGGDVALAPVIAGLALSFSEIHGTYDQKGGAFTTDVFGSTLYASVSPLPDWFIDATVGYVFRDYNIRRRASFAMPGSETNGIAEGDTHGHEVNTSLRTGYDFVLKNFTVGPRVAAVYKALRINGYEERGDPVPTGLELEYETQHRDSLTLGAGVYMSYAISTRIGVLVPQLTAEYVHEFLDERRFVDFRFVEDESQKRLRFRTAAPDRDWANLGAGLLWVLPRGFSAFANYRAQVGYLERSAHTVNVGLRVTLP
jgi:outer membrane autotransporter protein